LAQNKLSCPVSCNQPSFPASFPKLEQPPLHSPLSLTEQSPLTPSFPSPGLSSIRPQQRRNSSSNVPLHPSCSLPSASFSGQITAAPFPFKPPATPGEPHNSSRVPPPQSRPHHLLSSDSLHTDSKGCNRLTQKALFLLLRRNQLLLLPAGTSARQ